MRAAVVIHRASGLALALLLGTSAAIGSAGCGKRKGKKPRADTPSRAGLRVVEIRINDRTSPAERLVRLSATEVRQAFAASFKRHGIPTASLERLAQRRRGRVGAGAHRLRVDLEVQSLSGSEKGKVSVLIHADLRRLRAPPDEPGYLANALQEKVYKVDEVRRLAPLFRDLLGRAVEEVLGSLATRIRLRYATPARVAHAIRTARLDVADQGWSERIGGWAPATSPVILAALGDMALVPGAMLRAIAQAAPAAKRTDGLDVRELAIKTAAIRRLKETVPALLQVLRTDSRVRIRDQCLGALAEIRDPRAGPVLVKLARGGGDERLRKMIDVIGQVGGDEALAFLELIADGHADEDIRKIAHEALVRAGRRQPAPPEKSDE